MSAKIALASYITAMVFLAVADVGEPLPNDSRVEWYLPIVVFGIVALPAFFGYQIGKGERL